MDNHTFYDANSDDVDKVDDVGVGAVDDVVILTMLTMY